MNWERGQSSGDVSSLLPASYLAWCINLNLTAFRQHFLHFLEKGRNGVGPWIIIFIIILNMDIKFIVKRLFMSPDNTESQDMGQRNKEHDSFSRRTVS